LVNNPIAPLHPEVSHFDRHSEMIESSLKRDHTTAEVLVGTFGDNGAAIRQASEIKLRIAKYCYSTNGNFRLITF
jgi:hypothetical protein